MRKALAFILLLALTACGAAGAPASGTDQGAAATTVAATTAPESPAVTAAPAATTAPAAAPDASPLPVGSVEAKMADVLGQKLGVAAGSLALTSKEAQEWSTSGLGCEAEGLMYLQVITPGYKLTYSDGTKTYEVHTNEEGTQGVLCENGKPSELPSAGG